ncbi:MAG: phenylalanine 4-monooxygenase [Pyrinomonadaceae bacterium]
MNSDKSTLLLDHVDMRKLASDGDELSDRHAIVQLDPDHPGFRDLAYRRRRNQIAEIASHYEPGKPIPEVAYTDEEHGVWQKIWKALAPAHQQHACTEYVQSLHRLNLDKDRIPQLNEVSKRVAAMSGFSLEPVAGLVEPRIFLESLANGVFLCTQYIRHHSTPLYTPEPDVAHEIIGHAVTLASEPLAELNRLFGEAVKKTSDRKNMDELSKVYWFTIEFGVLRENGCVKAYGTGLLSSAGELEEMHDAEVRGLDLDAIATSTYDPTHYQSTLFCANSFQSLCAELRDFLLRW